MAEGASSESRKEPTKDVWAFDLFQNPESALMFCCIECGHPPKKCFVDNGSQVFCEAHAQPLIQNGAKINPNPLADSFIAKAQIICPNKLFNPNGDEKKEEPKQCDHKCTIKEWTEHNNTNCPNTIVDCPACHSKFSASRCLQAEHYKICGDVTIECEQKCGHNIFRKDQTTHNANDCAETILDCTNQGCKDKIARKSLAQHVSSCDYRIVECEYKKYGCPQNNVQAKDMVGHMQQFETKHLQFHVRALFDVVTQQQQRLQQHAVPSGMIQKFAVEGRDIPMGWMLCDGKNNTPDLRKKFQVKDNNEYRNTTDDFDVGQISECEMEEDGDDNNGVVPCYSMVYIMKS